MPSATFLAICASSSRWVVAACYSGGVPESERRLGHVWPASASAMQVVMLRPRALRDDRRNFHPQLAGDARAEVEVDVGPVIVDRAFLDEALHPLAEMPDDIGRQMVPVGWCHHLAVERAGLDE